MNATDTLARALDDALPQTQCTRCGYPDCHAYAQAMASGEADINRCPPGGAEGIARLAQITGKPMLPLDTSRGREGPLMLARIDEDWCIGCTLCLKACPVDCIVGGPKTMHTVIASLCTGCELCLPVCPVDCIEMQPVDATRSGWQAWSAARADESRARYAEHRARYARDRDERDQRLADRAEAQLADLAVASTLTDAAELERKRRLIEAAVAKARAARPPLAAK